MLPSNLFQEIILDHFKKPRNQGELGDPKRTLEGQNPSCGDHLFFDIRVEGDRVSDIRFHGSGCSISMASASMLTETVKGKSVAEALDLVGRFRQMMRGDAAAAQSLGELQSLQGVAKLPVRVKCATLAWTTLEYGLEHPEAAQPATTE